MALRSPTHCLHLPVGVTLSSLARGLKLPRSRSHYSVSHSNEVLILDPKPQTLAPIATRMYLTQLKKAV